MEQSPIPIYTAIDNAACATAFEPLHDQLKKYSLAQLTQVAATSGNAPIYANLIEPFNGPTVHEADYAVVRPMPFGNDASNLNQRLQSRVVAEALQQPVVSVSASCQTGHFDRSVFVPRGYFSPLAAQTNEALASLEGSYHTAIESLGSLAYVGWSQGASVALECATQNARHYDINWIAAGEPVNIMRRNPVQLIRDMSKADANALLDVLEDSGMINSFLEAYGVPSEDTATLRKRFVRQINTNVIASFKGAALLQQWDVIRGMGKPTFADQLREVLNLNIPTIIASAGQSMMSPINVLNTQVETAIGADQRRQNYLRRILFRQATHVQGDHMPSVAYMATTAMRFAQTR